jgi:hypothetical protein
LDAPDTVLELEVRRYAWTAKLPLSILTDFEEFAVYDCRIRPHAEDKASAARTMYLTFEDYVFYGLMESAELAGVGPHTYRRAAVVLPHQLA